MSEPTEKPHPLSRLGRWAAELVLVFVSVYAAFWLNNYQQHRQDAGRRDQILRSLEDELQEGIAGAKRDGANQNRQLTDFQQAVDARDVPPLCAFTFTTDYNPGDIATFLQAGGIELLDVKTLTALRRLESVIRWGVSRMAHYQKLSDELIVPNLDQEPSFFYDPATKKLRRRFEFYFEALQREADFFRELERGETELLKQIEAERQRQK